MYSRGSSLEMQSDFGIHEKTTMSAAPRAHPGPMPRLTAGELRSALGVRRCEGSPLFPVCVLPMRASGGARACFLCAPPRGGSGQRSACLWGDLWSLVDEVAAQGLEEAVLANLAGAAEEGGGEDGLAGVAEEGGRDATRRLVRALLHEWPAATSQHRRVVAALGRGAWRRLRATRTASMAAASPWLAGFAQAGDIAWLAADSEPSQLRDLTGVVVAVDHELARLRL